MKGILGIVYVLRLEIRPDCLNLVVFLSWYGALLVAMINVP